MPGIPSHGQPHSIPACRSLRGNTVMKLNEVNLSFRIGTADGLSLVFECFVLKKSRLIFEFYYL